MNTPETQQPSPLAETHGLANPPRKPIDIAYEWLKKNRQEWNGHIGTWTHEQMDNYHRDLGLLVDFVTDCWPNVRNAVVRRRSTTQKNT